MLGRPRGDVEEATPVARTFESVAVLLPCYNESITVQKVVTEFIAALPGARVYVFDNNSTDGTGRLAEEAGAIVVRSPRQGKGYVVQHMFRDVEADVYLMADGDDTYPASEAVRLLDSLLDSDADMVVGVRLEQFHSGAFRRFHQFGNRLVAFLISSLFGARITDVLSGYRAFERDFVKSVPLVSGGFGIETEMTMSALAKGFAIREIPIPYGSRPEGSHSKLSTYSDGAVVLRAIFTLFKDYKPFAFFGTVAVLLALLSLASGALPVLDYLREQYVHHVPLAILAAGLGICAALSASVGLVLSTIARYQKETFLLMQRVLWERSRRE
ncbi:MAG: glycosyltransferase [Deltaproteobacteria bacterium]|nr:glycosyltransferase [Deltaproteobacteria bacterium]